MSLVGTALRRRGSCGGEDSDGTLGITDKPTPSTKCTLGLTNSDDDCVFGVARGQGVHVFYEVFVVSRRFLLRRLTLYTDPYRYVENGRHSTKLR